MTDHAATGCQICAKHRGEGPLTGIRVWEDEHSLVFHRPVDATGTVFLGHLFVETRRHAPSLTDLTDVEAAAIGRTVRRVALGLRAELDPEFVFSAVAGMSHAHFHQHVFVRHRGTPASFGWMDGDRWPEAPRGGPAEVGDLCDRLRPCLVGDGGAEG
jgi:ATP adenylyltransferase